MIAVFKLSNNDTVIGEIDFKLEHMTDMDYSPYFTIHNPMIIVSDGDGLRMRDSLLMSHQNKLNFRSKDVITFYTPSTQIEDYYKKALEYSIGYVKPAAGEQVKLAILDLEEAMEEQEEKITKMSQLLRKLGGGTGTLQ